MDETCSEFWQGEFGNKYIDRNKDVSLQRANLKLFSSALSRTAGVKSILEIGCNIGLNISAIGNLIGLEKAVGIEINKEACKIAKERLAGSTFEVEIRNVDVCSQLDQNELYDLVFTKTVLIHIPPDLLADIYGLVYRSSSRYILLAEYYSPNPVDVVYRSYSGRLFKRDFCGEMLDRFKDLRLVDYGFSYRRDENFPQDDITWFLLEKQK